MNVIMKIYVIKESDYDDTQNHGMYLNKEKAIKKLQDLFNEKKILWKTGYLSPRMDKQRKFWNFLW